MTYDGCKPKRARPREGSITVESTPASGLIQEPPDSLPSDGRSRVHLPGNPYRGLPDPDHPCIGSSYSPGCLIHCYSPDYNPIEEAFAKIKNLLRKAAARTKEALVEAIGVALSAVTAADARGRREHAGYRSTGHLLLNML